MQPKLSQKRKQAIRRMTGDGPGAQPITGEPPAPKQQTCTQCGNALTVDNHHPLSRWCNRCRYGAP